MKICYIPSDPSGPGYYRCLFPATYLEKAGHEILFPPYKITGPDQNGKMTVNFGDRWPVADVYVIQRRQEKGLSTRIVPELQRQGHVVVLEADDDDFHIPGWHPAHKASKANPQLNPHWLRQTARLADYVTVSTPYLGRVYGKINPNVTVIQNYLEWEMWKNVTPVYERNDWERVRVGWMGAIALREGDIRSLAGTLGPWLRANPQVDFVVAGDGADKVHDLVGTPEAQRITLPGVDFDEEKIHEMLQFDIGLVPLSPEPFNEAKSYLKGMEYGACGIPCVAQSTEQYREWVDEGENGFLCTRPRDWTRSLDALVGDPTLRERMGRAARQKARNYSLDVQSHRWKEFFKSLEPDVLAGKAISQRGALQKQKELSGFLRLVDSPSVVVEIGTALGGVFFSLCKRAHPEALLVSIDLPPGETGEDGFDYAQKNKETDEEIRSYAQPGQTVHLIRGDSHSPEVLAELEEILDGRPIDLLFIDGDHTLEGVTADYETYSKLVRPGGMVAFHDILKHNIHITCDVDALWNRIKLGRHYVEIVAAPRTWGGIGVLYAGKASKELEDVRSTKRKRVVQV